MAILVAGFEATYSLHTGVERLGRYIQVFFEETKHAEGDCATWETTAMAGGPAMPRGGTDPLFTPLFCAAVVANLAATLVSDPPSPVAATLIPAHGAWPCGCCERGNSRGRNDDEISTTPVASGTAETRRL